MEKVTLSVSDAIAIINQTLEYAYPVLVVEGEIDSFKVNQNKFVFFDVKDEFATLNCFMMLFNLRMPLEDGMKVRVVAVPKLTPKGKFSLTVREIVPVGEGSIKRAFQLLKTSLEKEGLFALERKRTLPPRPRHIAVISSVQAAGYADFIRILNDRWGGMKIEVANVQVQGEAAADQIIRAIRYFNGHSDLAEVLVIIRGGGSADDLAAFNDELLVREIATSRIPTVVGVGHETDETLADLVADVRAATPSNAAQLLVPDRRDLIHQLHERVRFSGRLLEQALTERQIDVHMQAESVHNLLLNRADSVSSRLALLRQVIKQLNPDEVLKRGYALISGSMTVGSEVQIQTYNKIALAEVKNVKQR